MLGLAGPTLHVTDHPEPTLVDLDVFSWRHLYQNGPDYSEYICGGNIEPGGAYKLYNN